MLTRFMLFEIISVAILIVLIIGSCNPIQSAVIGSPMGTPTETAILSATIITIKANSTSITSIPVQQNNKGAIATSIPLSREGWVTFTSTTLGITLEYPPDWSVSNEVDDVTFTSPQGSVIVFALTEPIANSNEIIVGNEHCTPRKNAYSLIADVCVETVSFSYSAKFILTYRDGSTKWLTMKTITRTTMGVFEAMFNSVHQ